jgi:hypothetical protein
VLDQALSKRRKTGVLSQKGTQDFVSMCRGQRVEPELCVVGLAPPSVLVLRAIGYEQEKPCRREAFNQVLQHGLRLGVDPMEVFDHQEQGLHAAFFQQQPLDRLQEPLAALRWVEGLPCGVFDRHVQQHQEGGQGRPEGLTQREKLAETLACIVGPSSRSAM